MMSRSSSSGSTSARTPCARWSSMRRRARSWRTTWRGTGAGRRGNTATRRRTCSASIPGTTSRAWRPAVKGALAKLGKKAGAARGGIGIDTTGSTPCAVDRAGTPLALTKGFEENPNAMFVLWKDHTAVREAELINTVARTLGRNGLHQVRGRGLLLRMVLVEDPPRPAGGQRRCAQPPSPGWSTATGCRPFSRAPRIPLTMKRSRCAAGHKAMWHAEWGGLPPEEFLVKLDPAAQGPARPPVHGNVDFRREAPAASPRNGRGGWG